MDTQPQLFFSGFHSKIQLPLEQRIFIVESFGIHKSEVITFRSFQREFEIIKARPTVRRVKKKETVFNLIKGNCERKRSGRSEENIDAVRLNIAIDANISFRKLSVVVETRLLT